MPVLDLHQRRRWLTKSDVLGRNHYVSNQIWLKLQIDFFIYHCISFLNVGSEVVTSSRRLHSLLRSTSPMPFLFSNTSSLSNTLTLLKFNVLVTNLDEVQRCPQTWQNRRLLFFFDLRVGAVVNGFLLQLQKPIC